MDMRLSGPQSRSELCGGGGETNLTNVKSRTLVDELVTISILTELYPNILQKLVLLNF
jgi:hypothetical protein